MKSRGSHEEQEEEEEEEEEGWECDAGRRQE